MKNWTEQYYPITSGSCNLEHGYATDFYMPPIPYLSETHTTSHAVKMTKEVLQSIERLIALHYQDEERHYINNFLFDIDEETDEILSKIDIRNFEVGGDKHISELAEIGIKVGYNHIFLDFYVMKKWYDENLIARENILVK